MDLQEADLGKKGTAGNLGPGIRSDCYVELGLKSSGGIKIQLESKVDALYKESIQELALKILDFFDVTDAEMKIIDRGALPFVLAARIESAIKSLVDSDKEFWLDMIPENTYQTEEDQGRRDDAVLPEVPRVAVCRLRDLP